MPLTPATRWRFHGLVGHPSERAFLLLGGATMTGMDATKLGEIAATHGLRLVLEFGSVVTGRTHPRSDVDIAVLADHAADRRLRLTAVARGLTQGSRERVPSLSACR